MCGARPQHQIRDYSERRRRQQPDVKNTTPKSVPGSHDLASEMINTGLDMLTDAPEDTQISSLLNAAHVMFTGILLSETVKERALKVVEHYYHKDMSLLAEIPEEHYGGYKKHQN